MESTTRVRPVLFYIFGGLQESISKIFSVPLPTFSSNDNTQELLEKHKKQLISSKKQEGNPKVKPYRPFPFCYMQLKEIKVSSESLRADSASRIGMYTLVDTENPTGISLKVLPITASIDLHYITEDTEDLLLFISTWAFAAKRNRLDFEIQNYMGHNFKANITLESELNIPNKSSKVEDINHFDFTGNLLLNTFINSPEAYDTTERPLIHHVNLNLSTFSN